MNLLFGSLLIPKLRDDSNKITKYMKQLFGDSLQIHFSDRKHCFFFQLPFIQNKERNLDKVFQKFQKLMKNSKFTIHICNHGFVEIKTTTKSELTEDNIDILKTYIQNNIESKIQRCSDIYDYDESVLKEEISEVLQGENYLEYIPQEEQKPPFVYLIEKYQYTANQIIELRYFEYLRSIDKKHQINEINVIAMLYKVFRGHYLKLFYLDKKCCIINNEDHLKEVTKQIAKILNRTSRFFDSFHKQKKFVLNKDGFTDAHVISLDIEKFTFNVETKYNSSIVDQLKKFFLLSKWISMWLDNAVNQNQTEFDIPLTIEDFWIKCVGDGYIVAFKRPDYAYELSKYIKKLENSEENTAKLRVRIGLNSGQVRSVLDSVGLEDLIGPGINFAVRTMALSKTNHLLASNSFVTNIKQIMGKAPSGDNKLRIGFVKKNKIEFYNLFAEDYGTKNPPVTSKKPKN